MSGAVIFQNEKVCLLLNAKLSILECSAAFPNALSKDLHEITFSPQHSPFTGALPISPK